MPRCVVAATSTFLADAALAAQLQQTEAYSFQTAAHAGGIVGRDSAGGAVASSGPRVRPAVHLQAADQGSASLSWFPGSSALSYNKAEVAASDGALAASLQAEAWADCPDAMVLLSQDQALQTWKECARRVQGSGGLSPQRLEDARSRPPIVPLPAVDEVSSDEARLQWTLSDYGLRAREIKGDGACQFRAVADQLYGDQGLHAEVRRRAVAQLEARPDMYAGFAVGESFGEYVQRMSEPDTWGDNLSLQAIADSYDIQVCIMSSFLERRFLCICPSGGRRPSQQVWLGFYAEYHYTSLEPVR